LLELLDIWNRGISSPGSRDRWSAGQCVTPTVRAADQPREVDRGRPVSPGVSEGSEKLGATSPNPTSGPDRRPRPPGPNPNSSRGRRRGRERRRWRWRIFVWNDPINLMSFVTFVFHRLDSSGETPRDVASDASRVNAAPRNLLGAVTCDRSVRTRCSNGWLVRDQRA